MSFACSSPAGGMLFGVSGLLLLLLLGFIRFCFVLGKWFILPASFHTQVASLHFIIFTLLALYKSQIARWLYIIYIVKGLYLIRPHAADRPSTRLGEPSTVPVRVEGVGQPVLSFEQGLWCAFYYYYYYI